MDKFGVLGEVMAYGKHPYFGHLGPSEFWPRLHLHPMPVTSVTHQQMTNCAAMSMALWALDVSVWHAH